MQPDSLLNQISRARFLQVGVYYLTMFLLLKTEVAQRILSEDEKKEILTMGPYVALHYLPWMLCAKYAPRQVLTLYSFLEVKLYDILQCADLPPSADSTSEAGSGGDALCHHRLGEVGETSQLPVSRACRLQHLRRKS